MGELKAGLRGEQDMIVGRQDLASVMGNIGAEVLSTHRLVLLMEMAARSALDGRLPEGKITVGTFVQIKHYAATPLGLAVRAEAYLRKIDGRRLTFDVAAYDEFEKIAEGQNEQLIVSKEKYLIGTRRKTLGRMTAKNQENSP